MKLTSLLTLTMKINRKILWLGISMQKDSVKAFDKKFLSRQILDQAIIYLNNYEHHFDNLVNYGPLNEHNKIRYPTIGEIFQNQKELKNRIKELNPLIIIALGSLVTKSLAKIFNLNINFPKTYQYQFYKSEYFIIPVHHPSYIGVYKRKNLKDYIENIHKSILTIP